MATRGFGSRLVNLLLLAFTLVALGVFLWMSFGILQQSQGLVEELLAFGLWFGRR